MKKSAIFSILSVAFIPICGAVEPLPISKNYWKSEAFLSSFNGSYRINSKVEPFLETNERELLVSIQPLMEKGERKEALKKLQASDLSKTSASVIFNIGNVAFEEADLELAKKSYLAAIKKFPNFLRAHQNLAMIYLRDSEKGINDAYNHLVQAVKLGGQDASLLGMLGNCHLQKENYSAAMLAFKNAQLSEPETVEWQIGEAECHRATGHYEDALRIFKLVLRNEEYEPGYEFIVADLHERLEQYDQAISIYDFMRRKGDLTGKDKAHLGKLQLSEGSRSLGAELLREILKSGELKESEAIFDLLEYTILLDEIPLASDLYQLLKSDELKSQKYRYEFIGAWIGLSTEDKAEAADKMRNLIKQNPLDSHALYLLAKYQEDRQARENALLLYSQAANGDGSYKVYSLRAKGKLLVDMKRYEEAIKALKEYKKLSQDEAANDYIKAVKALFEASK